jgi:hypothetical protein
MKRIIPALLLGLAGASGAASAGRTTLYSAGQVPSNLSVLSISTASVLNVRNFGAIGDGATDDTAAFSAAIQQVNARLAGGIPATLYIPAGVYYLNGTTPLPTFTRGGSLIGDGPHKTYVALGPNYAGDVFSWSDAWMYNSYLSTSLSTILDQAGAQIQGLSIVGSRAYTNQQNAFVFYDRDDMISMRDVQVFFLNGRGLYLGVVKNVPGHAYVRESRFSSLLFWQCGTASLPAVEINSVGPAGDDATNELSFYGTDVIQPIGRGLVIRNSNASVPIRLLRFYGLRVEGSGPGEAGDLLDIGDTSSPGNVNNIQIYGFESNGAPAGSAAIRLSAASVASQPYNVTVEGTIPTSNGDGVHVDAGRQIRLRLADIHAPSGYAVVIGPAGWVGGNIDIDGNGAETGWTYKIDPTSPLAIRTPAYPLLGDPSSNGARAIAAGPRADGTAAGGNMRGAFAIDLQTSRGAATQVASGFASAVISGMNNSALGTGSVAVGGSGNTSSGSYAFLGAGQGNTISGLDAVLAGGASNTESGSYGAILGGLYGSDRGRFGTMAFASGNFSGSSTGDAQFVAGVFPVEGADNSRATEERLELRTSST